MSKKKKKTKICNKNRKTKYNSVYVEKESIMSLYHETAIGPPFIDPPIYFFKKNLAIPVTENELSLLIRWNGYKFKLRN